MTQQTNVALIGVVVGRIWMPATECTKDVSISESEFRYSDGSRPTLRDLALRATNDGDFQSCSLTADSFFEFQRVRRAGNTSVVRTRVMPVTAFRSVADCIDSRESCEVCGDEN